MPQEDKSYRIYSCDNKCDSEFLRIDLAIETEDILLDGVEQKIFRYIIRNTGSKSLFGNIIICSKLFNRIRQEDVFINPEDQVVIQKIIRPLEDEEARAFIKLKDLWLHSKVVKLNLNIVQPIVSSTDNVVVQDIQSDQCYVSGVISNTQPFTPGYRMDVRFYNNSNVDAINTVVIVNFDNSVNNIIVREFLVTPFSGYRVENQRVIFDSITLPANTVKMYRITFTTTNVPYNVFAELVITTDTPNRYQNLLPIIGDA